MLPAFSFASVRRWRCAGALRDAIQREVSGQVIAVPARLAREEVDALIEALELAGDLPVEMVADLAGASLSGKRTLVLTDERAEPPPGVDGSVVVYRTTELPPRRLEIPPQMRALTHALAHHAGMEFQGDVRRAHLGRALLEFCDTPGTVRAFLQGALFEVARDAEAMADAVTAAGVASTLEWLLRPVNVPAAEFFLARALGEDPLFYVSDVGDSKFKPVEKVDLFLAELLSAGLVEHIAEEDDPTTDLRRPAAALGGWLRAEHPARLEMLRRALSTFLPLWLHVFSDVRDPWERLSALAPPAGESRWFPETFVQQVLDALGPSNEVVVGVVVGSAAMGRYEFVEQLRAAVAGVRSCLWIDLRRARSSWRWVERALRDHTSEAYGTALAMDRFSESTYVFFIDGADTIPPAIARDMIPRGRGSCAVVLFADRDLEAPLSDHVHFKFELSAPSEEQLRDRGVRDLAPLIAAIETPGVGSARIVCARPSIRQTISARRSAGSASSLSDVSLLDAVLDDLSCDETVCLKIVALGALPGTPTGLVRRILPRVDEAIHSLVAVGAFRRTGDLLRVAPEWSARPVVDRWLLEGVRDRFVWQRASASVRALIELSHAACRASPWWVEVSHLCDRLQETLRADILTVTEEELRALALALAAVDLRRDVPRTVNLLSGFVRPSPNPVEQSEDSPAQKDAAWLVAAAKAIVRPDLGFSTADQRAVMNASERQDFAPVLAACERARETGSADALEDAHRHVREVVLKLVGDLLPELPPVRAHG